MRESFAASLRCPVCQGSYSLLPFAKEGADIREGVLRCACASLRPIVSGVPRILPADLASTLPAAHPAFFAAHPDLAPPKEVQPRRASLRTVAAFGDEWHRFAALHEIHSRIFRWYFEQPPPISWRGLRVLDAGCGMGRWLHFARREGANVVAMDASRSIDVVAAREPVDAVQADLRQAPFPEGSFDLVYCLGVLHHLEDPFSGLLSLARLVRPGGQLRIYVYRSLETDRWPRRLLLSLVTWMRQVTTRLPFWAVHAVALGVAIVATPLFLWPRRALRHLPGGDRATGSLPLAQYADIPFQMLVAEQFDRFAAPIEIRYRRDELRAWFDELGFEILSISPDLGWRVVARRPQGPSPAQGA